MRVLAEIDIDASPESLNHAQYILDNWTKHNPLKIRVTGILEE